MILIYWGLIHLKLLLFKRDGQTQAFKGQNASHLHRNEGGLGRQEGTDQNTLRQITILLLCTLTLTIQRTSLHPLGQCL